MPALAGLAAAALVAALGLPVAAVCAAWLATTFLFALLAEVSR